MLNGRGATSAAEFLTASRSHESQVSRTKWFRGSLRFVPRRSGRRREFLASRPRQLLCSVRSWAARLGTTPKSASKLASLTTRDFQDRLSRRARRAGVRVSADLAGVLETYYRLLAAWNKKINLSGLNLADPTPEAIDRLLIEPLVAAKHAPVGAVRMIDVGSGGGSPAIPFALAVPGLRLLMVESKTRKSVFLREAARTLGMTDAEVACSRFEELLTRSDLHEAHDLLTIRAVRLEPRVLMSLQAFIRPGGLVFLFRSSSSSDAPSLVMPPLAWRDTFPLLDSLGSRVVILEKRLSRR